MFNLWHVANQKARKGEFYTLFLSNNQIFVTGTLDYGTCWDPGLLETNLPVCQIYSGVYPQFATNDYLFDILQIGGIRKMIKYHFQTLITVANNHQYTLLLVKEDKEVNLYARNYESNELSKFYNLNNEGFEKVPITGIIDISDDGRIILTDSKLYSFNKGRLIITEANLYISDPYTANIIDDKHCINLSELNKEEEDGWISWLSYKCHSFMSYLTRDGLHW